MKIWPIRRTGTVTCADAKQRLSAFLDCQLRMDELAAMQRHVDTCRKCQEDLKSLEATVAVLRQLPEAVPGRPIALPEFRPSRVHRTVPALGMVTVMVGLLLVFTFTADITNLFQTTPSVTDNSYSENDGEIGRRGTLDVDDSSPTGELDQDAGTNSLPTESAWVRPLEYSLLGTVVVLGGVTFVLWRRTGRPRAAKNRPE